MKNFLLLPVLPLLFCAASCTTERPSEPVAAVQEATAEVVEQTAAVVGTWQGSIPCADCPGITYTLQLFPDHTYQETMVYQEREVEPVEQAGTWKVDASGTLRLQSPDSEGASAFKVMPDALVLLGGEGNTVEERYRLKRINKK
ncbi:copper resistance protein NlpE [Pontibacter actiniarum]|uniref:Copper homeostasis protein n=1 Tax=Pontibacter actiniarum TaxID=323450 RepID=A0A1X9YSW6_9BACT|nr:copper resistance protein NlpE [Pontibacter actiniarum]ARS35914.1 copper homeostasis protein [Pontibacter actiniarum]